MNTYTVHAKRWAHGWELHIEDADGAEVGVTQSRSMAGAEDMVRDYLALDLDAEPDSFDVVIRAELDTERTRLLAEMRRLRREADRANEAAAEAARKVARQLKADGLRGVDIAAVLEVSPGRVSQLMKDRPAKESA